MKNMKVALLAGAAVAVSAAAAHADELQDLKAQVEDLNARMAAMETAPSVPTGYQLIAISKGDALQVPGLDQSNRDRFTEGSSATIISVMPTADAPAGTQISWSGYVNAAVIYNGQDLEAKFQRYRDVNGSWVKGDRTSAPADYVKRTQNNDDWDVKSRSQLKVVASTDTAVGEVGVEIKLRADLDGNGTSDVYLKTGWGYWAMTPELTLGGGYTESLGNIGYGYDGSCTCYYTDGADVGFNPGDTTQMRLSYASGPFSAAIAIEDGSTDGGDLNGNNLGAAGQVKYSGDMFSGEISGVYRSTDNDAYEDPNIDGLWQIGAGLSFGLGDVATISLAAAYGQGPFQTTNDSTGNISKSFDVYNEWWGVSGLLSANLSDTVHAEFGAGYKNRQGDNFSLPGSVDYPETKDTVDYKGTWNYSGFEYDTYSFLGGLYYNPVDQLTIGVEGEWYTTSFELERTGAKGTGLSTFKDKLELDNNGEWTVDLVSVWRF